MDRVKYGIWTEVLDDVRSKVDKVLEGIVSPEIPLSLRQSTWNTIRMPETLPIITRVQREIYKSNFNDITKRRSRD